MAATPRSTKLKTSGAARAAKYVEIAEHLRHHMQTGTLKPGDRLPSFAEMRTQFGATPTTVERVYSLLEQEGLILREQGRGTFVAELQQRQPTGVIGVSGITAALQRYAYWSRLMEAMRGTAESHGADLLLLGETSPIRWEKVDGVLLCGRLGVESMHRLPPGMPSVAVLAQAPEVVSVVADEVQGVEKAVQHLIDSGHRRIAYLVDPLSRHRLAAYRTALYEAGVEPQSAWVRHVQDDPQLHYRGLGHAAMSRWLHEDWRELGVTACLVQNDEVAIGAIEALQEADIRVPDDVSVIGYDGNPLGDYFSPKLTSVSLPIEEIGTIAVDFLTRQMRGEKTLMATTVLPTNLKLADSTRCI